MVSTLVIIPTYNELESLPVQIAGVREHAPDVDILVVDDSSPDGTGEWADQKAESDAQVHVLHRPGKQGLGVAYRAGFAWGLERGYETLVEMDADGSHQAHELPSLLARTDDADLVIGSRWVPGGSVKNWPRHRKLLSTGANTYVRLALGIKVRDATAGFRAYSADMLRRLDLDSVESQGYCFQIDMCWHVLQAGGTVVEVPIEFVERAQGASKMSGAIIREALMKTTAWGFTRRFRQVTGAERRERDTAA
ncbi:polyprenol monophosphomannose synthase [Demequina zhanjiangensis]|uniref:Polyprenol monophosphomannose synthase n=1 Tax=Demequina zhanjiangensis TaxID=3051659 RepID=A0ABT8G2E1_9MICO|nr:polyprenol monophosphomannose synthase [Demequina sp. SYSU T00b26]MDN4473311.1 polyprenol monophosphomannose synthase [Demequina sp. SYSU T00b26]